MDQGSSFHAPFWIVTITRARASNPLWSVALLVLMPWVSTNSFWPSSASRSAARNSGVPGLAVNIEQGGQLGHRRQLAGTRFGL